MKLDHLEFPDYGWGYMPPQEDVYAPFKFVQERFNPQHVLEIGFHIGHSTTYQLEIYENAKILGISPDKEFGKSRVDAIPTQMRRDAAETLGRVYPGRFTWLPGKTKEEHVQAELHKHFFDFALLDGNHSFNAALLDAQTCENLDIPAMLVDNWDQGEVRRAVRRTRYKFVKDFTYEQTFKGKTSKNKLALVSLDMKHFL
jgi:hypothetical protein